MKKILLVISVAISFALIAVSCGKTCVCTRYEDGKKVVSYKDSEVKIYEKSVCTDQSEAKAQGYSIVTEGKMVEVEIKCK